MTSDRTGRLYVADARNQRVQVLADTQNAHIVKKPEPSLPPLHISDDKFNQHIVLTKVSRPLQMINTPDRIKYAISKNMLLEEIKAEMAIKLGLKKEALSHYIQVVEEERLTKGQIKLTVSIPKEIPLETNVILSRM